MSYKYCLVLSCLFVVFSCQEKAVLNSLKNDYILDINDYYGDKLLLCAGNPAENRLIRKPGLEGYYGSNLEKNNRSWYTVDVNPKDRPNHVANLLLPSTYDYLEQKKFDIILDENCVIKVSDKIVWNAAKLLKPGGIVVSKYKGQFFFHEHIKRNLLERGMAEVIFGAPKSAAWNLRNMTKEQIIDEFRKSPLVDLSPDSTEDSWYWFVAIKK